MTLGLVKYCALPTYSGQEDANVHPDSPNPASQIPRLAMKSAAVFPNGDKTMDSRISQNIALGLIACPSKWRYSRDRVMQPRSQALYSFPSHCPSLSPLRTIRADEALLGGHPHCCGCCAPTHPLRQFVAAKAEVLSVVFNRNVPSAFPSPPIPYLTNLPQFDMLDSDSAAGLWCISQRWQGRRRRRRSLCLR